MKVKFFFLILLIFGLLFSACAQKDDTLKIGISLPLTGDAAIWGKSLKEGYDLALNQINQTGGIKGKRLELIYGDDQGLPKEGISLLQKFITQDKIKILTGVANSSVALAMIPIVDQNKILFISSGASSPKLSGASKLFLRTWPSDIAEAIAMANFARDSLKYTKIAILYINNEYGIGLQQPYTKRFQELGGQVVSEESFEQDAVDFRAQLTKIKKLEYDAIYLAGNPREMARCIKQAKELGIQKQILGISTLKEKEVLDIAGAASEGVLFTDASYDPNSSNQATQKFVSSFEVKFSEQPGILAVTAYDAMMVIKKSVEECNCDLDTENLAEFLRNMGTYQGASGTISFDANGDVKRDVRITAIKNGKFEFYASASY